MSGIIGNFAAQPRVFGHDAAPVVVGAVNALWPGDINGTGIGGYEVTVAGANYAVGETVSQVSVTGGGQDFDATVAEVDENGGIVRLTITNVGKLYNQQLDNLNPGDPSVITLTTPSGQGAVAAQITITNIDIPGTHTRGVAILTEGNGAQTVKGVLESGRQIEITAPGAASPHVAPLGGNVPLLFKRIITPTTEGRLIAIY